MQRRRTAGVVGLLATALLGGCASHVAVPDADTSSSPTTVARPAHPTIDVSLADCGSTWRPRAGL